MIFDPKIKSLEFYIWTTFDPNMETSIMFIRLHLNHITPIHQVTIESKIQYTQEIQVLTGKLVNE